MHFVFLSTNTDWGGSETLWVATALLALAKGHSVSVYLHENMKGCQPLLELEKSGAEIKWWHTRSESSTLSQRIVKRFLGVSSEKRNWWKDNFSTSGNIICINQGTWEEVLRFPEISRVVLESRRPYACLARSDSARGGVNDELRDFGRKFYEGAAAYIAASRSTLDLAKLTLPCHLENGSVLHSPIRDFSQQTREYPSSTRVHFSCVGRLQCSNKGQNLLLKALASARWRNRDWDLTFYGEGPDRNYLEELAGYLHLNEKVHFGGYATSIGEIWRNSHMLLQPSIIEGVPQSMLEAMLCRRPVIATAVSGIPEWIEDGKTGFLAAAPQVDLLEQTLERALESRESWQNMGIAAREALLAKYEPDPAGKLLEILIKASKK